MTEDKKGILLETGTGELEILEFTVKNTHYAINVIKIKEILEIDYVTKVPKSNPALIGLTMVRGDVIPLIDMNYVLEKEFTPINGKIKTLLCEFNQLKVAFCVDEVHGIHRIGWNLIKKPDMVIENSDSLIIGNITLGERIIMLLDFEKIVTRYPETLKCIPILLAVRSNEIYAMDEDGAFTYHFKKMSDTIEQYKTFMRKTGLFQLMQNHHIRNLLDYVTGVETGLDSNGRKNRGGHLMEDLVEKFIQKAGFRRDETYFKEMTITKIHQKWGIDLSAISNDGKAEKRFDYVIKMPDQLYVIETNFYTSGGSKLNETARSYKTIANEVKTIRGVTFLWFTDGKGWRSARGNLRETFDVLDTVYNIQDLENGVLDELRKRGAA